MPATLSYTHTHTHTLRIWWPPRCCLLASFLEAACSDVPRVCVFLFLSLFFLSFFPAVCAVTVFSLSSSFSQLVVFIWMRASAWKNKGGRRKGRRYTHAHKKEIRFSFAPQQPMRAARTLRLTRLALYSCTVPDVYLYWYLPWHDSKPN